MAKNEAQRPGEDDFVDLDAVVEDPLPTVGFELPPGDDRRHMLASALDYADPKVIGNLNLIRAYVQDGVDVVDRGLFDQEEGGFGAGDLVFDRSFKDSGSGVNNGFQIIGPSDLKRWKSAGRIPRTIRTADQFYEWQRKKADRKPFPVGLDVVSTRRLTAELIREVRPDYQRRPDDKELS